MSLTTLSRFARLRSKQGNNIRIDYKTTFDQGKINESVTDIHFTVIAYGITESAPVVVKLIENFYFNYATKQNSLTFNVPLRLESVVPGGYNFIGSLSNTLTVKWPSTVANKSIVDLPQIAISINGEWQIDPIQPGNQHNFNFIWQDY